MILPKQILIILFFSIVDRIKRKRFCVNTLFLDLNFNKSYYPYNSDLEYDATRFAYVLGIQLIKVNPYTTYTVQKVAIMLELIE